MADLYAIYPLMALIEVTLHLNPIFKYTTAIISLTHQFHMPSLYTRMSEQLHTYPTQVLDNTNPLSIHPKLMKIIVDHPLNIHEITLIQAVLVWSNKWAQKKHTTHTLFQPMTHSIRYSLINQTLIDTQFMFVRAQFQPLYEHIDPPKHTPPSNASSIPNPTAKSPKLYPGT